MSKKVETIFIKIAERRGASRHSRSQMEQRPPDDAGLGRGTPHCFFPPLISTAHRTPACIRLSQRAAAVARTRQHEITMLDQLLPLSHRYSQKSPH